MRHVIASAILLAISAVMLALAIIVPSQAAAHANFNRHVICYRTKQAVVEVIAHAELQEGKKYAFLNVTRVVTFTKWADYPKEPGHCI
jgi:nucleoside permease NupC